MAAKVDDGSKLVMEKPKKELLNDLKKKSKAFLDDRKNANNLIDIISISENQEIEVIQACVRAFHRIFTLLISTEEMYFEVSPTTEHDLQDLTKEEKYKMWLRERYADARTRLLELLVHDSSNIQELTLCTLMKLIAAEGQNPLKKISSKHVTFPVALFEQLVSQLLSESEDLQVLIGRFQEFLEYDDVRYYCMKTALKLIKEKPEHSATFLQNTFTMLENLSMPSTPEEGELGQFMSKLPESDNKLKMCTYKEHKKMFTMAWLAFLRCRLSTSLYKKVLPILHDKVMPHMTSPLQLSDFLTESYNIGGAISLLALNGIFILVNNYNLEYPDFYKKLYALFEPCVFHVKYSARFFYLSDLFLTSTHLPAYLVAAFAKRLSRLALTAPPSGVTIILPFVYNLIRRHPNLKVMLNRTDDVSGLEGDPFDNTEVDPAKCKALNSSLWEIKTLQSHYYHNIATEAKKIDRPLPVRETELGDILDTTTSDMFKKETKKKFKEMPVTYIAPKGIFGNKDDKFKFYWSLE